MTVVAVNLHLEQLSTFELFLFFLVGHRKCFFCLTAQSHWSLGGDPLPEVHYSLAHTECVRSPIFSLFSRHTCRTYIHKHILLNGRALLLPQSMEYHICLFTPRFLPLNSINIYIAAEGVGSPSCSGGKLSLDENELQSSLPRHSLVCLYLHYPAIPQLPLFPSW